MRGRRGAVHVGAGAKGECEPHCVAYVHRERGSVREAQCVKLRALRVGTRGKRHADWLRCRGM